MPTLQPRFLPLSGLVGAVAAAAPGLLLPWILPPPPAVQAAVMVVLAGHGYAAAALVRVAWRRLLSRPGAGHGTSSALRRLAVVGVLGLLAAACLPAPLCSAEVSRAQVSRAPNSVLPSAGPGSLIPWDSLGQEGQRFMGSAPHEPVRTYVGLRSGRTLEQRVRLAVGELERTGGLARSTILVVVPTGSGWVNPAAVAALESLTAGDLATIAIQYAERPSWAEYLLDRGRAADSARSLVVALRQRLETIPPQHRPRLLIYGESLGALAARSAAAWADQALLVGEPGAAGRHRNQDRSNTLLHTDDPVGWWSPRLLFARPDGWRGGWLPVVSFWQVTGSLLTALDAPAGHGHHYGAELVDAWCTTIHQAGYHETCAPGQRWC